MTLCVAFPMGITSSLFAVSSAAVSLCHAVTAETSAGDQWTSGRASESANPSNGQPHVLRCRLEYPVDLTQHRVLAFASSDSALVEGSCDHHNHPSQSSETATVVEEMFLCVSLQHSPGRVIRSSRTLVSCAAMITPGCSSRVRRMRCTVAWPPSRGSPLPPDLPPLRTSVYSVSVVATPGSTPNRSQLCKCCGKVKRSAGRHIAFWWDCASWLDRETNATDAWQRLHAECEPRVALGCLTFAKQPEFPT